MILPVRTASAQTFTTRTVPTPIGDAHAIEIQCGIDGITGGLAFHTDGYVTMSIGNRAEVVMSKESARAFINALHEQINKV